MGKCSGARPRRHGSDDGEESTRAVACLVTRIAGGDLDAEEELFRRFGQPVQNLLFGRAGSHALAEDLRQETFRIVLQRLRSRGLEDPRSALAFVFGTALKLLHAERRRMARSSGSSAELPRIIDPRGTPLTNVLTGERDELLRSGLARLCERDRQILWRFYFLGDDKEEIRRDLDVKSLHFNRLLFRARERLRAVLESKRR